MYSLDLLLLLPILLPLFGAGLVFLSRARKRVQDALVVGTVLLTFAGTAAIYLLNPEHRLQLVFFHLVDYGLSFRPTNLGILFACSQPGFGR